MTEKSLSETARHSGDVPPGSKPVKLDDLVSSIRKDKQKQHVLISGCTASGKSSLALGLADRIGGVIVNADALQVFSNWRILTARPGPADTDRHPHRLYGHITGDTAYSAGQWLREVAGILETRERLIIVGGTGLYFSALTEGLADIPQTPASVRNRADEILASTGTDALLADLDPDTLTRIDQLNPVRVQRAWEVQQTTGRGLARWQDETPPPLLPADQAHTILLSVDREHLNNRIAVRFSDMLAAGVLDEVQNNLKNWSPTLPSSKAIGAAELVAHLRGEVTLAQASDSASTTTRQYAKRQRSWFRRRMSGWDRLDLT